MPGLIAIVRGHDTRKVAIPLLFDEIAAIEGTSFSRIRAEEGLPKGEEEYRETVEHARANFASNYTNFIWALAVNMAGVSSEGVRNRMIDSAEDVAKVSFIGEDFNFSNDLVEKVYHLAAQEVPSDRALEIVKVGEQVAHRKGVKTRLYEEGLIEEAYSGHHDYNVLRKKVEFARNFAKQKGIDVTPYEKELSEAISFRIERDFRDRRYKAAMEGSTFLTELTGHNHWEYDEDALIKGLAEETLGKLYKSIINDLFKTSTEHVKSSAIGLMARLRHTREFAAEHQVDTKGYEIGILDTACSHLESWKWAAGYETVKPFVGLLRGIARKHGETEYIERLDALRPSS